MKKLFAVVMLVGSILMQAQAHASEGSACVTINIANHAPVFDGAQWYVPLDTAGRVLAIDNVGIYTVQWNSANQRNTNPVNVSSGVVSKVAYTQVRAAECGY